MSYINKAVIFTEKNFGGDAIIFMQTIEDDKEKHLEISTLNLQVNKKDGFNEYQKKCQSFISEKGVVTLIWSTGGSLCEGATSLSELSNSDGILKDVFLKSDGCSDREWSEPFQGEVKRQDYFLTFYPNLNAYFISPAPLCEVKNGKFRWVFHDDDTFNIEWDADGVEHAYLEFFRHDESGKPIKNRDRALPIKVKKKPDLSDPSAVTWIEPLPQYAVQKGETIKLVQKEDGALWAFNFCSIINGQLFVVDPEGKYGSGTHK